MRQLIINDLDFCETELPDSEPVQGGILSYTLPSTKGLWNWDIAFDFSFDHDGISNFAMGHISSFAMAFGGLLKSFTF